MQFFQILIFLVTCAAHGLFFGVLHERGIPNSKLFRGWGILVQGGEPSSKKFPLPPPLFKILHRAPPPSFSHTTPTKTCMNLILSPADSLCNVDVDYNSKLHLPTSLKNVPTGFVRVGLTPPSSKFCTVPPSFILTYHTNQDLYEPNSFAC